MILLNQELSANILTYYAQCFSSNLLEFVFFNRVSCDMSHSHSPSLPADYANIWTDLAGNYVNYGKLNPDTDPAKVSDLVQANENMVEHIITTLDISRDSHVLDLGCGNGMYTVEIAKRTGCRFLGTDINPTYLEKCRELARDFGVEERGEFIQSSWEEMSKQVKETNYTHVLAIGSLYYGHGVMDQVLTDIADCCRADTKIFLWDFVRCVEWSKCTGFRKHLDIPHPLLTREEYVKKIEVSRLALVREEDMTPYILPAQHVIVRECRKRDPDMVKYTNPYCAKDFLEGSTAYPVFYLKLK